MSAQDSDIAAGILRGAPRRLVVSTALRILQPLLPFRVEGAEFIPPDGPLLIVANHLSNADPPLIAFAIPRLVFFMGKSELFRVPLLGKLLHRVGGFPVERGTADRAALRFGLKVLKQGYAMAIFPEGGRSRTYAVVPGLPGVGLLALQSEAPVLPVAITGTEFYPLNGEWPPPRPKDAPRGVTVRFGQPFHVPRAVDGKRVTSEEATRLMMSKVAELLPESYRGVYSGSMSSSSTSSAPRDPARSASR